MIDLRGELQNIGINPIKELSIQEKAIIVEQVTEKLMTLNVNGLFYHAILEKLFESQMYRAKMRASLGKVNYFYKNKTIYFNVDVNINHIDENIMRECIHCIQDTRRPNEKWKPLTQDDLDYALSIEFPKESFSEYHQSIIEMHDYQDREVVLEDSYKPSTYSKLQINKDGKKLVLTKVRSK